MNKVVILALFIGLFMNVLADEIKLTNEASIDSVLKEMTLEEKAKLVGGIGMGNATKIKGVAGGTFAIPRLGIPEVDVADGPVGLRIGGITGGDIRYTTAFPISTAMASSWDRNAMYEVGKLMGYEAKENNIDVLLGPAINIQRDPLGGRNFEYYTEDPYLNGELAVQFVNGVQSNGVGVSLKHYAANNTESMRMSVNQMISERSLREIYLPAFEKVVKQSDPWTVMSAYPSINGEFASQNKYLLRDILREEWGYKGIVMSDWFAIKSSVEGLRGGTDLSMPYINSDQVVKAVNDGTLDIDILDNSVKNILKFIIKTQTFKNMNNNKKESIIDTYKEKNTDFLRKFTAETMVLVKNNDETLPISKDKSIGIYGNNAYNFIKGGGGSSEVHNEHTVQLLEGLKNTGYSVVENNSLQIEGISMENILKIAKNTEMAIVSIGKFSSEGTDKYTMDISDQERELIKNVSDSYHSQNKKLIVLLNIGAPIEIASWEKYADAILITWQPGQEAGNAVADILSGNVNPSAKLTETFPVKYKDAPTYGNGFPQSNSYVYGEGIFVGYRYYDSKEIKPMYEFGYGLSYTKFEYSNLKVNTELIDANKDINVIVSVDIKNVGKKVGKEIAQLYVNDKKSLLVRPEQELKGFEKVELKPGEQKTVKFTLDKSAFSYYNDNEKKWVMEPGEFEIRVGGSSRDIRIKHNIVAINGYKVGDLTKWENIRSSFEASKIVEKYIGSKAMDDFYWSPLGPMNFGDVLKVNFIKKYPEKKENIEELQRFKTEVYDEINR